MRGMKREPKNHAQTLREILASQGIASSTDAQRRYVERHLQQIVASRRAMESALGIAMVTSAIPGIEVRYID
jgi:hypothetical protein